MANLKTLLASLLESFLLTVKFKQAVAESATINSGNVVTDQQNGSVAPFDGYVVVSLITEIQANQTASFLYIDGTSLCMFGLRGVTNMNQPARYFSPCKKGQSIFYDGSGTEVKLTFVPFSGSS